MYEFRSLEDRRKNNITLSSQAMTFGGYKLDTLISGYRTLRVDGRETQKYSVSSHSNILGLDGSIFIGKNLDSRYLTIHYRLKADNDLELQEKFRQLLDYLLIREDVQITFDDDPNIIYYGQVTDWNIIPSDTNDVVSSFTITCSDPYKYESEIKELGFNQRLINPSNVPVEVVSVDITVGTNRNGLRISNGTKHLDIKGSFSAGDKVNISLKDKVILNINGSNGIDRINEFTSTFKVFEVRKGNTITTNSSGSTMILNYRTRWE